MSIKRSLVLKSIPALSILLLLTPGFAFAVAGKFQFVGGDVVVKEANQQSRRAAKGDDVNEGDTIISGKSGFAQIVMQDGGRLAVKSDTEMKIETYKYNGIEDGKERALYSLLKGGIRAVTGEIGRTNKENYTIKTPAASIGIRGTDHEAYYIPVPAAGEKAAGVPGTYDRVISGATILSTKAGSVIIPAGQTGFVGNGNSAPVLLSVAATAPSAVKDTPSQAESGLTQAQAPVVEPVLPVVPIAVAAGPAPVGSGVLHTVLVDTKTNSNVATDAGNGAPLQVGSDGLIASATQFPGASQVVLKETGFSKVGGMYWGRYGYADTAAGTNGTVHVMWSTHVTTPLEMEALRTNPQLVTGTYSYVGGTSPTRNYDNHIAGNVNNMTVKANFSSQMITAYDLNLTFGTGPNKQDWDTHLDPAKVGNATFANFTGKGSSAVNFAGVNPAGYFGNGAGIDLSGFCTNCRDSVNGVPTGDAAVYGKARGMFSGDNAQGLMTSYQLHADGTYNYQVNGTAALVRDAPAAPVAKTTGVENPALKPIRMDNPANVGITPTK